MKAKVVALLFIYLLLISFFECEVVAWGPITHMTLLDDILNDSRLNADVKNILQENLKYAKGGVTGPDLFYMANVFDERFANMAHYCSPGDLAQKSCS